MIECLLIKLLSVECRQTPVRKVMFVFSIWTFKRPIEQCVSTGEFLIAQELKEQWFVDVHLESYA